MYENIHKMKKTTMRLSYDNFWTLEGYRVLHKLGSKDEAVRRLLEKSKKEDKKE